MIPVRTKVKICGVTRVEDAALACKLGADAIGLNFYPPSPRCLNSEQARQIVETLPPFVESVAVFVDARVKEMLRIVDSAGIAAIQLHGNETPQVVADLAPRRVLRAFRWKGTQTGDEITQFVHACEQLGHRPAGLLIDAFSKDAPGGTGEQWDWSQAVLLQLGLPLILAGGLRPDNVAAAISQLRPFAVDVASGVESAPGIKDRSKMQEFFASVCAADRKS